MRNRHISRVCRNCRAPMARQEDMCWRCGVEWASEETPPTTLRRIPQARLDAERWTNEGGSFASDGPAPLAAVSARG